MIPTTTCEKCKPVRKKNTLLYMDSLMYKLMLWNSFIWIIVNVKDNTRHILRWYMFNMLGTLEIYVKPKDIPLVDRTILAVKDNVLTHGKYKHS
jgi:hypothetical protein